MSADLHLKKRAIKNSKVPELPELVGFTDKEIIAEAVRRGLKVEVTLSEIIHKFSTDELKEEIKRRRKYNLAKKHIDSVERALIRAKEKAEQYRKIIREEEER